jgi:hypothetical protein
LKKRQFKIIRATMMMRRRIVTGVMNMDSMMVLMDSKYIMNVVGRATWRERERVERRSERLVVRLGCMDELQGARLLECASK